MLTPAVPPVAVAPARVITLELATVVTGLTRRAIEGKIARGDWLEGREYLRAPDGRIFVDLRGYEKWVGLD
jgi:hypothetical protein